MGALDGSIDDSEPTRRVPRRPLRGREYEQARLHECCGSLAATGDSLIILIEGDAGMGKTRLLAELPAVSQMHGVRIAVAACDPIAHDRPFGPLLEALGCNRTSDDQRRRAIAERVSAMGSLSAVEQLGATAGELRLGARYGIQDDLIDLALEEAEAGPFLVAIDDAQWLDAATASTIGALVRRRGNRPLGLIVAARRDPRPAELDVLLDRWHEVIETIPLGPLPPAVASEVAADVLGRTPPPGLLAELARAGGNAFSVVALSRGYAEVGSAPLLGVRASVLSRVHRLGDDATRQLTVAAVLGVDFSPETLATLTGRTSYEVFDVLYGATRAGLLVSRGASFAFSHALVAEQLIAEVPLALRAAMHRSVVQHGGALGLGATTIAYHAMSVWTPGDLAAIDGLCQAAAEVASHDPELALGYLDHAAKLCSSGSARRTEVTLRRSAVLCTLKRVGEAVVAIDECLTAERDPSRIADLRVGRARCAHLLGDLSTAADTLEQLAQSGMLSTAAEAAAWADVATYRFWLLNGDRPWAAADRAIALADACGVVAPAVQAIAAQATMAAFDGDVARALELATQASARGLLLPHDQVIPSPAFTEGLARMLADDLGGAIEVLQLDRQRIERLGDPLIAGRAATALVIAEYLAGRWDDAVAEASALAGICSDTGTAVGQLVAPVITGLIAHHRGEGALADSSLGIANAITGATEGYAMPFLFHLQALRLEATGHPDTALALLLDTVDIARAVAPAIGVWFAVDAARLLIATSSRQRASVDRLLGSLERDAARVGLPGGVAFAAIVAGALRDDVDGVLGAVDAARASPHLLTRAAALEMAGEACRRGSSMDAARALLIESRDGYERLGATPLARRVSLVDDNDSGPLDRGARPARPRFGWEALTPAELAVLNMVVDAKRNGEIAESLVLSKRTVESHISSMLVKLGVRTRVELVVAANRRVAR